jgi:hypothetical protein
MFRALVGRTRGGVRARGSVALAILGAAAPAATAQAATVVNYTFHVPASVQENPCSPGDFVNLSGDIHVVITSTTNGNGYRIANQLNSQMSGESIVTGARYVSSENRYDGWYAGAPFPTVHTNTYDWNLISQSGTANYVLHMTTHETVTANGVPTATVDNWRMDCQG